MNAELGKWSACKCGNCAGCEERRIYLRKEIAFLFSQNGFDVANVSFRHDMTDDALVYFEIGLPNIDCSKGHVSGTTHISFLEKGNFAFEIEYSPDDDEEYDDVNSMEIVFDNKYKFSSLNIEIEVPFLHLPEYDHEGNVITEAEEDSYTDSFTLNHGDTLDVNELPFNIDDELSIQEGIVVEVLKKLNFIK